MTNSRIRASVLILAAASLACAPAPRMGEAVDIAEESAIIIWDAAAKTQHFIRRASFRTQAKDFGFLVPTPSVPELKEAGDEAFDLLERITAPPVPRETAKAEVAKAAPPPAAAPQVVVVAKAKVAGYDATVLKANDAGALDGWLKTHGYHSSPELLDWYKPYIEKKWIITAFKIDADAGRAEGSAVRMSFKAEQPFFPYREPKNAAAGSEPRLLRVYFLGDARVEAKIGSGQPWPGRAVWSNPLLDSDQARLFELLKLPRDTAPDAKRLTEFQDGSSPRPGSDDLFFSTAADQSTLQKTREYGDSPRPRPGSKPPPELSSLGENILALILLGLAVLIALPALKKRRK